MAAPAYGPDADPIEVVPVVVLSQVFPARPSSIPDIRDFVRRCLAESPLTDEGNRQVGETVFRALLDAAGPTGSIQVAFRISPEHVEVDVLHSDTQILPGPRGEAVPATPTVRTGPASPPVSPPAHPAMAPQAPAGHSSHAAGRPAVSSAQARSAARPATRAAAQSAAGPAAGAADKATGPAGPAADGVPGQAGWPAEAALTPAEPVPLGQPGQPATFAEWMSTALRREGLTQEAAARQLGVSVKTVSRWVGGATEPRMRDLRRIQEVFGQVPLP